ncbi:MAG: GyrI-like domain-containing protein [Plesiomonas sp.]|uniref:GyrI-like domain-containing protein n=1 Tax=Plesiomonas sp. TaxID=2486279 RepID=UPI003F3A3124
MPVQSEFRIEHINEMFLMGIRKTHALATLAETIPTQWVAFNKTGDAAYDKKVAYGVICSASQHEIEYMCGIEVPSLQYVPEHMGKIIIPKQKYAVFVHQGHISEIGNSWSDILNCRMPELKLEDAFTPSFERYGKEYNVATGFGDVEIWCPIK